MIQVKALNDRITDLPAVGAMTFAAVGPSVFQEHR